MNLDHLEELLETMSPEEIRREHGEDLKAHPQCEAMLRQFESMDTDLLELKSMEACPPVAVPKPRIFPRLAHWVLPAAAVLVLGFLIGSGLMKESLETMPTAALEAASDSERVSRKVLVDEDELAELENRADDAEILEEEPSTESEFKDSVTPGQRPRRKAASPEAKPQPRPANPASASPKESASGSQATAAGDESSVGSEAFKLGEALQKASENDGPQKPAEVLDEQKKPEAVLVTTPEVLEESVADTAAWVVDPVDLNEADVVQDAPTPMKKAKANQKNKPAPLRATKPKEVTRQRELELAPTSQAQSADSGIYDATEFRLQSQNREEQKEGKAEKTDADVEEDLERSYTLWMNTFRSQVQKNGQWTTLFADNAQIQSWLDNSNQFLDVQGFRQRWQALKITPGWTIMSSKKEANGYLFTLSVLAEARGPEPVQIMFHVQLNGAWKCQRLEIKWAESR